MGKHQLRLALNSKTFLLFIFISAIHASGMAQKDKIADSLLNVLKTQKEDTNRVNTLLSLSKRFRGKYKLCNKYSKDAVLLAEKLNFKEGLIKAYSNLGDNNYYFDNYKEAMEYYTTMAKLGEETGNKGAVGFANYMMGNAFIAEENYTEAVKYFLTGVKLFEESGDKGFQAGALYTLGDAYYALGNFTEAIKAYMISIRISREIGPDKLQIALSYIAIGNSYRAMGNYPEAIKNYLAGLKISEELGDKYSIGAAYNNIGGIYSDLGNYSEAKKTYLAGLKLFKEINDRTGIQNSYNNLGSIYQLEGNYTEALNSHLAALKINEKTGDTYGWGNSYKGIGNTYFLQKNYHDALKNYQASLKLFKKMENKDGISEIYKNIGEAYFKLIEFPEARQYFNDALSVALEIQVKEIIEECYQNLASLDSVCGNWEGAFINHKLFLLYRDSVESEKNSNKITEMRMQFEFDKKEDSLKYQQALTNDKQTLQLKKQKQFRNYLLVGFALLILTASFAYYSYRTSQQLKVQKLRNKIASDLHDDVGSTLSSISMFSQMAQQQSKETIPLLDSIGDHSRKMLDAMADIVWTINPENDQFEQIILRMRNFAYDLLGTKNIEFAFDADEDVTNMKLSMDVRKSIYLIFKEATNNMAKYSGADQALFSIKNEKNNLIMLIHDNGKGFNTSQATNGNGLRNMRKRAEEMGADLRIESGAGKGTTIELSVAV